MVKVRDQLILAAGTGKTAEVQNILTENKKKLISSLEPSDFRDAFFESVKNNHLETASLICQTSFGYHDFFIAVVNGNLDAVKNIMQKSKEYFFGFQDAKNWALRYAFQKRNIPLVAFLLTEIAPKYSGSLDVSLELDDVNLPFNELTVEERLFLVSYCATQGASLGLNHYNYIRPPIGAAPANPPVLTKTTVHLRNKFPHKIGNVEKISPDINERLKPYVETIGINITDIFSAKRCLQIGAKTGQILFIEYALQEGTPVEALFDEKMVVHDTGHTIKLTEMPNVMLPTAAHLAIQNNQLEVLKKLIDNGAFAFQKATYFSYFQSSTLSLQFQDLNRADLTLIEVAIYSGSIDCALYLWDKCIERNGKFSPEFTEKDAYRLRCLMKRAMKFFEDSEEKWESLYQKTLNAFPQVDLDVERSFAINLLWFPSNEIGSAVNRVISGFKRLFTAAASSSAAVTEMQQIDASKQKQESEKPLDKKAKLTEERPPKYVKKEKPTTRSRGTYADRNGNLSSYLAVSLLPSVPEEQGSPESPEARTEKLPAYSCS